MADDPIPARARAVLALFANELRGQRFGDLDAEALEALAERARAAALDVERARVALEAAQAASSEAREALTARAEQALAYAKVFAAGDSALAARLAELDASPELPKRPPRKRKARGAAAAASELPFEARGAA